MGIFIPIIGFFEVALNSLSPKPEKNYDIQDFSTHLYKLVYYRLKVFDRSKHERIDAHLALSPNQQSIPSVCLRNHALASST